MSRIYDEIEIYDDEHIWYKRKQYISLKRVGEIVEEQIAKRQKKDIGISRMLILTMFTVPSAMQDLLRHVGQYGKMGVCRGTTAPTAEQGWTRW